MHEYESEQATANLAVIHNQSNGAHIIAIKEEEE